jgi:hypothetical protein
MKSKTDLISRFFYFRLNMHRFPIPLVVDLFQESLKDFIPPFRAIRKKEDHGVALLSKFEMINQYEELFVHEVTELKSKNGLVTIMLMEKHFTELRASRFSSGHTRHLRPKAIEEYEPVLVFIMPSEMGKIYIKEETFGEKIVDLLVKVDIDFKEYPGFSKNYFMTAENPDVVRQIFPKQLLTALNETSEMNIEINGRLGLIRPQKNLSREVLHQLLKIGDHITR